MDLTLSDRHLRLQTEVRRFIAGHGHLSPPVGGGGGRARPDRKALNWQARLIEAGYAARSVPRRYGGYGAEPDVLDAAIIAEECLFDLDAPIMRLCGPDVPAMPYAAPMEKFYMLSPEKCLAAMRELAQF